MTDRASAEGLREALRKWLFPKGFDHPDTWSLTNEGAAAIASAALLDTGPRPDSDPWPDLDGADRVCVHGTDTSEECPECGFGFSTPRTETSDDRGIDEDVLRQMVERPMTSAYFEDFNAGRLDSEQVARALAGDYAALSTPRSASADRLALIHRPVTNPMYPRPICEDDGQEWPCKTAIVARLSTPRTETSE